jgi:hypothetical protein
VIRAIVVLVCAALTAFAVVAVGGEVRNPSRDARAARDAGRTCVRPSGVARISFSSTKYPNIRRHFEAAVASGWPGVLVLNRRGAEARRARLLDAYGTRPGMDRDEYPPAVGRRRWQADVAHVPSAENRSHGATLGIKLRRFCDGTRFRYVFY